jgi:riboflavin biosynthesis pyrimidine reductase
MNTKPPMERWDTLVSSLEEDIAAMADSSVLQEPDALERARALRLRVAAILKGSGTVRDDRPAALIPRESTARRQLLRRVMARRSADPSIASVAFQEPDRLTDSEVDALLRDLLHDDDLDEGQETK